MAYPETIQPRRSPSVLGVARLPEPRRAAMALGAGVALLGVLGAVDLFLARLPGFALDGERSVPAMFSSGLLLGAGLLAWQVSTPEGSRFSVHPTLCRVMGAFFAFMALDELLAIHERVSTPVSGISWQVFYAPVVALAAIGWLKIMRLLPSLRGQAVWIGGAAAWFVAQVIEAVQWDGNRLVYPWTIIPEETLEMTGSLMWGLALLLTLQHARGEGDGAESQDAAEPLSPGTSRRRAGRGRERVRGADRSSASPSRTPTAR